MNHSMLIAPETRPDRLDPLLFVATLIIATLLYLATNGSVVGVVLPCFHAGWKTFRTGLWLLRIDPNRIRARVCFIFYIATAFWKVALAALVSMLIFGLAENNIIGRKPNIDEIKSVVLTLFGGITLNTFIGIIASIAAVRYRIRVWVHPRLRMTTAYDSRLFSIFRLVYRRFNHAIFVVGTTVVFPPVILGIILAAVLTCGNTANHIPTTTELIVLNAILWGGPLAMIPCYMWLSSRIIARNPRECWPDWFIKSTGLPR
jgi:hypothetical protein